MFKLVIEPELYKKGGNEGRITYQAGNSQFLAVTAVKSGWFKTQRGAEKFMERNGYTKVSE